MKNHDYIREFLKSDPSRNYLSLYHGQNSPMDDLIDDTIYILFSLVGSQKLLMSKCMASSKRTDVMESILFIARGLEIANSSLYLLLSSYYPAPKTLLSPTINYFWFSYLSLINPVMLIKINPKASLTINFREEASKSGKSYIGKYEIKDKQLKRILTRTNEKPNLEKEYLNHLMQILYGAIDLTDFNKNRVGETDFHYSPARANPEVFFPKVKEYLTVYRTFLEVARVVLKSNFQDFQPTSIYSNFRLDNVKKNQIDDYLDLYQYFNNQSHIDCNVIPFVEKTEEKY